MKKNLLCILVTGIFGLASFGAWAQVIFLVEQPQSLAGGYDFTYAETWAANMDTIGITAPAAFAYDATNADSLACSTIANASEVAGKIAVLYRGTCNFSLKAYNVQQAGAVACVIINNIPGSPVGMAGGVNANDVTIPVVMISNTDGALLKDAILNDEVVIYLGNNTGVFAYNVGTYPDKVSRPKNTATPLPLVQNSGDTLRLSVWAFNYGNQEATGVKLNAVLSQDGNEILNQTTSGVSVPANGDSVLLTLPELLLSDAGYYELTYNVSADSIDEFPSDNQLKVNFWLNNSGIYAKSRYSPVDGPASSGAVRPADDPFEEWEWCTALQVDEANDMRITGVSFATTTADSTIDLDGKSVFIRIYEWNDYVPGGTTFGTLNELTDLDIYDYTENLDNEFVTYSLPEAIDLIDNQRYLTCLLISDEDLYVAYDTETDYTHNYNTVFEDQPISPLYSESEQTWFLLGFGNDAVPAIITIMEDPNSVADDAVRMNITPYPNPTTEFINIPLGGIGVNGQVVYSIFNVTGSLVASGNTTIKSSDLRIDVSELSSGLHIFNLQFEDNSTTSFRVVVTR